MATPGHGPVWSDHRPHFDRALDVHGRARARGMGRGEFHTRPWQEHRTSFTALRADRVADRRVRSHGSRAVGLWAQTARTDRATRRSLISVVLSGFGFMPGGHAPAMVCVHGSYDSLRDVRHSVAW